MEIVLDSLVAQIEYLIHLLWDYPAFIFVEIVVVPPSPDVATLVYGETVRIDCEAGFSECATSICLNRSFFSTFYFLVLESPARLRE